MNASIAFAIALAMLTSTIAYGPSSGASLIHSPHFAGLEEASASLRAIPMDAQLAPMATRLHGRIQEASLLLRTAEVQSTPLARAVGLVKLATELDAARFGVPMNPVQPVQDAAPSRAFGLLADRFGIAVAPEDAATLHALDAAPNPFRSALARFVMAFLAFDVASATSFGDAQPLLFKNLHVPLDDPSAETITPVNVRSFWDLANVDPGPALVSRQILLDRSLELQEAFAAYQGQLPRVSIDLPPAFALDLAGLDSTYTQWTALTLDFGGNDMHRNNAGGGGNGAGLMPCISLGVPIGGASGPFSPGAAALIDFAGADHYGGDFCTGIAGGAAGGAGFLLDLEGDDTYDKGRTENTGSAAFGLGLLIDIAGNDRYAPTWCFFTGTAWDCGRPAVYSNGAGTHGGIGFLLDLSGNDTYAGHGLLNGAGGLAGEGRLIDLEGNDRYFGWTSNLNGAGGLGGLGFLLDQHGDDHYTSLIPPSIETFGSAGGVNGAATRGSVGLLVDVDGTDFYGAFKLDHSGTIAPLGWAVNGGARVLAAGALLDLAGNDTYVATTVAVNGGADNAVGLLWDGGGRDTYHDEDGGAGVDVTLVPKGTAGAQIDHPG